jgi:hypothetical protein
MENTIESLQEKVVELRQQHANDKVKINNMGLQLQALVPRQQGRVFTLFRKLLKELRLSVRETILCTPQIVSAHYPFEKINAVNIFLEPMGANTLLRRLNREARNQPTKVPTCHSICSHQIVPSLS